MHSNSKTYCQFFFAIGVLLFLLRPYLGYWVIEAERTAGRPIQYSWLMQRLVKKKEEHHLQEEVLAIETSRSTYSNLLSIRFTGPVYLNFLILRDRVFSRVVQPLIGSLFRIIPDNHRYRSTSLLRI